MSLPDWAQGTPERRAHIERVVALLNEWANVMHVSAAERDRWLRAGCPPPPPPAAPLPAPPPPARPPAARPPRARAPDRAPPRAARGPPRRAPAPPPRAAA